MNNEVELVKNTHFYYPKSMSVFREFGGPSLYFHVQAIYQQRHDFMSERHIEMIYATLASWGMHRMGDPDETKAKMTEFSDFKQSIIAQHAALTSFLNIKMENCSEDEYSSHIDNLKPIYTSLAVSISESTLVAHSKTLAHLLPDFVPPIDRQYTVRFFTQDNKNFFTKSGNYKAVNLPAGIERQFSVFKEYSVRIKRMFDQCDKQQFQLDSNTFNTSYPKIMDNMIMAFVKSVPKPE